MNVKEKLTPEKVHEMLKAQGKNVTTEQAAEIFKFLSQMTEIVVKEHVGRSTQDNSNLDSR